MWIYIDINVLKCSYIILYIKLLGDFLYYCYLVTFAVLPLQWIYTCTTPFLSSSVIGKTWSIISILWSASSIIYIIHMSLMDRMTAKVVSISKIFHRVLQLCYTRQQCLISIFYKNTYICINIVRAWTLML